MNTQHIIVTGSHRSGSTWVGKCLSASGECCYLYEPFNPRRKSYPTPFVHQYDCVNELSPPAKRKAVERYMQRHLRFDLPFFFARLFHTKGLHRFLSPFREVSKSLHSRKLFKDPLALLSLDFLNDSFSLFNLVVIRHPAAFVGSHKEKGWSFSFNHLLNQAEVVGKLPEEFVALMQKEKDTKDLVVRSSIWWLILHWYIKDYQERREEQNNWFFVKHEDLSIDPENAFRELYDKLGLRYSSRAVKYIRQTANAAMDKESKFKRNSAANIYKWKKILSEEEQKTVQQITRPVSQFFYSSTDW